MNPNENFVAPNLQTSPTTGNVSQTSGTKQQEKNVLNDQDFDTLIKSVQLLRISQIRYIVQKYSLPANGNKTKLLQIVVKLLESIRHQPLIKQIYQEVMLLLAKQDQPFFNPLQTVKRLQICQQVVVSPPPHPFIKLLPLPPILGPIVAQSGTSNGFFEFMISSISSRVCINFTWQNNTPTNFSMFADVNGFLFAVNPDDFEPLPLDITEKIFLNRPNLFTIRSITTETPIAVTISRYEPQTIQSIIKKFSAEGCNDYQTLVCGRSCNHEPFSLVDFLSKGTATNIWKCPICGSSLSIDDLVGIHTDGQVQESDTSNQ
ncbi:MIZ zinc finger family protein [Histomonas meleagridis]|uniref:MIZ zinc finger family protein n=1 Tax=Histomonas meleagridis TaxID=135588 RepID=UPI0035599039|nr:MIZ zinc finger family protein [Histomonas meleagridis]